ncbi:N-acetyltransferase DgcN [Motiliproteus sp. MSK22-1]|uniref:N-acetyltransferase DgcN n=1 Tax=Motiliproteus sp. MSK22-1 TaxID=1897630 RepID=UPI000977FC9A|nr:N-acetyltransferase DgcN [Motiliproteus sp. MSK22-1]OMH25547.1 EBNA-1 nuclear protein [Motiliproteus sp. MSK22-1]
MSIKTPYLLFLGNAADPLAAKVAQGIRDWRPENCVGQLRLEGCNADLGLTDMTPNEAAAQGAKSLVVGVANRGGVIDSSWVEALIEAMESGLDLAAGLHNKLADIPELAEAAKRLGRQIHDVRHPTRSYPVASGTARCGKRLLAVGTDCSCGKMYTTLAIEKELRQRGVNADFRATGQTGILITGDGVSIDAVAADFISGSVEFHAPENTEDHWDIIEGQGSLYHASFAGVSLGLLHGSQADALVLCHEPTRTHMRGLPDFPLPSIKECMEANLRAASLTNKDARFVGIAINTSNLSDDEAMAYLSKIEQEFDLPTVDPVRTGVARIVDNLL